MGVDALGFSEVVNGRCYLDRTTHEVLTRFRVIYSVSLDSFQRSAAICDSQDLKQTLYHRDMKVKAQFDFHYF